MKDIKEAKAINPVIILGIIIILAAIATYIVPAGSFDRVADKATGYDKINIDSFAFTKGSPIGFWDFFKSLTMGLQGAASIIFFLLIMGGTFEIVNATGALHSGLSNMVRKIKGAEILLVPICIAVFSTVTCFAACCEEYLAFVPLMYVVCVAAGFDSITAVAVLFCSSAVGYAGGVTNAFTVGVAQSIADLPLFSGAAFRMGVFIFLLVITIAYITWYSYRIKKNPNLNTMKDIDKKYAEKLDLEEIQPMTTSQKLVLIIFALGFVAVAVAVIKFKFYIDEMSAIFLIVGILCGIVSKMGANAMADNFVNGCRNLVWAAVVIGMCKAVTNIMADAKVLDTLVYYSGLILQGLPVKVSAFGMFILQDLINILIPSVQDRRQ